MAYNLGTAQGNIRLEYDSRGVLRARDDLGRFVSTSNLFADNVDRDTKRADKAWSFFGINLAKTAKIIGIVGLAANALQNAIIGVVGATQALLPIIEATLAIMPAVILAAAGAAVVLKVAMAGVGDAVKAAFSQDIDKFNESLKKLAPEAQNFAKALFEVVKQSKGIQQALQNALFKDTGPIVAQLAETFKQLAPTAQLVAQGFNAILLEILKFANTPQFILAVSSAMQGLSEFLKLMAPGFAPLLKGFADLAAQGGKFFDAFGNDIGNALAKFGEFLGKVDVGALFERAGTVIQNLSGLLQSLGSIIGSVVDAFTGATAAVDDFGGPAATLSNTLGILVGKVAEFFDSAEGSAALSALATAFQAIATAAGDVLLSALQALAPVLVAIAPTAAVLARVLGAVLTSALQTLAPIVLQIAEALNASLGPVLPIIMDAVLALIGPLGQVAAIFGGVLAQALQIIGPLLAQIAPIISQVLVAAIAALLPNLQKWGQTWLQLSSQLLPAVIPLLQQLGPILVQLAPLLAMGANIMLTLLIPAMKLFVPVAAFMINMTTNIIAAISGLINWILKFVGVVTSAWDGVSNATQALRASIASAASAIGGAFSAMASAVRTHIGNMLGFVRSIPGQIQGALGNLGGMLVGAGADLIQGLINGIRNMASQAAAAARNVAQQAVNAVKGALGISSPSKVAAALGREVPAGLAQGILDAARLVNAAVLQVANMIPAQLATTLTVDSSAAMATATGTTASPAATTTVPAAQPQLVINQTVNPAPGMNEKELANETLRRLAFGVSTGTSSVAPGVA